MAHPWGMWDRCSSERQPRSGRPSASYVSGSSSTAARPEGHAQLALHPAAQLLVDHRCADERRQVELPVGGIEQERPGLRAAEAAVGADELLEGGDLAGLGVVEADDRDVADVLDVVEAPQGGDRELAVAASGSSPSTRSSSR